MKRRPSPDQILDTTPTGTADRTDRPDENEAIAGQHPKGPYHVLRNNVDTTKWTSATTHGLHDHHEHRNSWRLAGDYRRKLSIDVEIGFNGASRFAIALRESHSGPLTSKVCPARIESIW